MAVSGAADSVEILDRRRVVITDPSIPGANQPYHYAMNLGLTESETYLANCAAASERLALEAVGEVVRELQGQNYKIAGSAVLLALGRPLPSLSKILASHALIHTAEGEFFRNAIRNACQRLEIRITAIREREVEERAKMSFADAASRVQRRISSLGSSVGPPWTKDHKMAALAAAIVLTGER